MRSFLRTRYGCDFCKKIGGSKGHMAKHEAGCTANPNRVCALHPFATEEVAPTMQELLKALADGGYPLLVQVSGNCPACKLAALRQNSASLPKEGTFLSDEPNDGRFEFDFKEELRRVWDEYNERKQDERY